MSATARSQMRVALVQAFFDSAWGLLIFVTATYVIAGQQGVRAGSHRHLPTLPVAVICYLRRRAVFRNGDRTVETVVGNRLLGDKDSRASGLGKKAGHDIWIHSTP